MKQIFTVMLLGFLALSLITPAAVWASDLPEDTNYGTFDMQQYEDELNAILNLFPNVGLSKCKTGAKACFIPTKCFPGQSQPCGYYRCVSNHMRCP